ncbi:MAG TPA: shikimate dehydrogenase [Thermomicrobiales bacterium]|nr:shikimate dehydrogenase [Thermomicrobiales bacterium]
MAHDETTPTRHSSLVTRHSVVPLLGHPVAHSLSPAFQDAAFAAAGIPARYVLWDVAPGELAAAVARLREPGVLGANVTVPHKEAVVPLLDALTPRAARVGAVNTIVKRGAALEGDNTDLDGFLAPLRERGLPLAATRAVLLGAGGAARAVAAALLDAGAPALAVANRTPARAVALARDLGDARVCALGLDDPALGEACAGAGLLVNATSAGWGDDAPPAALAALDRLPPGALVYDLTYRATPFLRAAAARGLATLDGLPMLVEQGALAWRRWTGREPPRAAMRAAAAAAVAARDAHPALHSAPRDGEKPGDARA